MSRRTDFLTTNTVKQNAARAIFGIDADEQKQWVFQVVALWPNSLKELGRYIDKKGRVHPAIEFLLEILVPALCQRNAEPFKMFAESVTSLAHPVAFHAVSLACELTGYTPPFNKWGMASLTEIVHRSTANTLSTAPVNYYPESFHVPMTEAEFLRKVKDRFKPKEQTIEAGYFNRLCRKLRITFTKEPAKGGRKRKSQLSVLRKRN
jgi:hypothetical protein